MKYGQFCPIAKATEIVGERWTLLIIRELLMGTTRFSDFQRALSQISPTLLTKRLNQLVDEGLAVRKTAQSGKRSEYHPTLAAKELGPVVIGLGEWGMRWARGRMSDDELDVELLMYDLCRRLDPEKLPGGESVLHFSFTGLEEFAQWWIVIDGAKRELCVAYPGREPDVRILTDPRTMVEVYAGDLPLAEACRSKRIGLEGSRLLVRTIADWLPLMALAHAGREDAGRSPSGSPTT